MTVCCYHCYKPLGQLSFKLFNDAYKGDLVEGGRKAFCNKGCHDSYLQKYYVEEYKGNKIYWVLKGRQKYYIPYVGCSYGFKTIEGCRERMDAKHMGAMF